MKAVGSGEDVLRSDDGPAAKVGVFRSMGHRHDERELARFGVPPADDRGCRCRGASRPRRAAEEPPPARHPELANLGLTCDRRIPTKKVHQGCLLFIQSDLGCLIID